MEAQIASVSNFINKRACIMVLDCLSNNVCELLEKYFEEMDQKYAGQSNHVSVQLGTVR